jgi:hypothetical protein
VFGYVLTAKGGAQLRRGVARLAAALPGSASPLPDLIEVELARSGADAAVLELSFGAGERIRASRGEAGFMAMRRLLLENLLNAIGGECVVASTVDKDYVLIRNASPEVLAEINPALLEACQEVLSEGLEPELGILRRPVPAAFSR